VTPSFSRVPFTQAMGLPRVTVRIDGGQPVPAIVDLGATASVVSAQAASSAGLSQPVVGGGGAAVGADGRATTVAPRVFGSVRIGDVEIQRPTLLVGDLPVFEALGLGKGPAMLLGLDLLDRRTIVLDYKNGEIVLSHAAG
jgi:predicted aspartyl protease